MNMAAYLKLSDSEKVFADLLLELISEIKALRHEVDE